MKKIYLLFFSFIFSTSLFAGYSSITYLSGTISSGTCSDYTSRPPFIGDGWHSSIIYSSCEYSTAYTENLYKTMTCLDGWTSNNLETCNIPPVVCVPAPEPEKPHEVIAIYKTTQECQAAYNTTFSHENLTCWFDSCAAKNLGEPSVLYGVPKSDTDGDGIPNDVDEDDDGDGILDYMDPDHPDYGKCLGDSKVLNKRWGKVYNNFEYDYKGTTIDDFCGDYVYILNNPDTGYSTGITYIDSAYDTKDLNPVCIQKYCYVHDYTALPKPDECAKYSAADRQPAGYVYRADPDTEDECISLKDGVKYNAHVWDVPSPNCPTVAFCFLKPVVTPPDTNSTSNPTVDSNSTSADNKALVDAANITNKHLTDITDEAKTINKNLTDVLGVANNILTSSKDINNKLSDLNSKTDKTNSNLSLMNDSLSAINDSIKKSSSSVDSKLDNLSTNMAATTTNTKLINDKLQEGLFGDDPFAGKDLTDDGSSTFGDLRTQASDSFSLLNYDNIFGFAHSTGVTLPTYSVNLHGSTITIFTPSMLDGFPIAEMRSLIMFIFALLGFITIFRTV